jgi:putative ATPase
LVPLSLFEAGVVGPLAERLRPKSLKDVIGQDHLLGNDGALRRMLSRGRIASFILWGPPGVGKTTIARLVVQEAGLEFVQLSAVLSGTADLRRHIEAARNLRAGAGKQTAMFIDELHRFNRATQDALLPHVEDGTIILIGATTENPSFSLVGALLSRTRVFTLESFGLEALELLLQRAEAHEGVPLPIDSDARTALKSMADGDARYLLNLCEELFQLRPEHPLSTDDLSGILQKRAPLYDKGQDNHYNLLSCFHKSLRGSCVQSGLYWAARMMNAGEDANVVFRRLACAASEDVGMADPQALMQVMTAWDAFRRVGWPEGRLFMAQAITYVATAPKSNAAYKAFNAALSLARETGSLDPPLHILNAPTSLMKDLGYHKGYSYDHDFPDAFSGQQFLPDALTDDPRTEFYVPEERGFEREIKKRVEFWRRRRNERSSQSPSGG